MNPSSTTSTRMSMLGFALGGSTCCIPVSKVVTVFPREKVIELPRPRPAIQGLVQHQSRLVPLLDLEELFGGRQSAKEFILIAEQSGAWLGLLTGTVDAVTEVEMSQIHHPTPGECPLPPGFVRAIVHGAEAQYVLNLEAICDYLHQA